LRCPASRKPTRNSQILVLLVLLPKKAASAAASGAIKQIWRAPIDDAVTSLKLLRWRFSAGAKVDIN
jgi:hypothetical protein